MARALFLCENLSYRYRLGNLDIQALTSLSLEIPEGELYALAGPSGSGKSTLLNLLGLIEPVQEGRIFLGRDDLSSIDEARKNQLRREALGFVFQRFLLFDTLTAAENVAYFLKHRHLSRAEESRAVDRALESVGLSQHAKKRPLEMSGGQRQRVAIARALVKNPTVVIADEPTASLDQTTGREVMQIFSRLAKDHGKTIVLASHDPMALSYATKIARLRDGRIERVEDAAARREQGETHELH